MSHPQPRRDDDDNKEQVGGVQQVSVSGYLADQTIAPHDAATMQMAEYAILGGHVPGGPADTMASSAAMNQYYGAVGGNRASDASRMEEVTITETHVVGGQIVTEFVARPIVAQYMVGDAGQCSGEGWGRNQEGDQGGGQGEGSVDDDTKLTIGEALEASGRAIGNEPVQPSDVAAIRAAETCATGIDAIMPGGLTDQATTAATANLWATRDETKIKLGDVLSDATAKLPADKPAELEDAKRVVDAEAGSKPDARTRPGGVAAAVATAARVNQDDNI